MSSISRQGQNFNPWTTYTSGKYKQFLGGVTAKDAGGADSGGLLGTIVDDAKSVATLQYRVSEAIVKTTLWVTTEKNWLRVGYVLVGGAAVLAGTLAVINSTSAGATAVGAAKKAAVAAAV
jgi:hypothetical protein